MASDLAHVVELEGRLRRGIEAGCDHVQLNGPDNHAERYPGNVNLSFAYVEGESLLMGLRQVAVSSGSACTSASLEPSYVLRCASIIHVSLTLRTLPCKHLEDCRSMHTLSVTRPHQVSVRRALGVDEEMAHTSVRFGLGRFTTAEEVDLAVQQTTQRVGQLREMSPLWEMVQNGVDLKSIVWSQH
jgi:cysteine desulfurase